MDDIQTAERRSDDSWTATKLIVLAAITLTVALSAIWLIASAFAPPGYH